MNTTVRRRGEFLPQHGVYSFNIGSHVDSVPKENWFEALVRKVLQENQPGSHIRVFKTRDVLEGKFLSSAEAVLKDIVTHAKAFEETIKHTPIIKKEFRRLVKAGLKIESGMDKIAEYRMDHYVALDGKQAELDAALKELSEIRERLTKLVSGKLEGFESPALQAAHEALESTVNGARKMYTGFVGRLNMNGGPTSWKAITKTAQENFSHVNKGIVFARSTGVAVGAAMAGDALMRGKDVDGKDRSALGRMVEFVVGGGVAAGSALAGRV